MQRENDRWTATWTNQGEGAMELQRVCWEHPHRRLKGKSIKRGSKEESISGVVSFYTIN